MPTPHSEHVAVPEEDCPVRPYEPAGHGVPVHAVDPVAPAYVPDGQFTHVASAAVAAAAGAYLPMGHSDPEHDADPGAEYFPAPHTVHTADAAAAAVCEPVELVL